jgi:hypothetical protein
VVEEEEGVVEDGIDGVGDDAASAGLCALALPRTSHGLSGAARPAGRCGRTAEPGVSIK